MLRGFRHSGFRVVFGVSIKFRVFRVLGFRVFGFGGLVFLGFRVLYWFMGLRGFGVSG